MPTSSPFPIDWSAQLGWMIQLMLDLDAGRKRISENCIQLLGDQLAQMASLEMLRVPGSMRRLTTTMDQALAAIGLEAKRWRPHPNAEHLPLLGLHAEHGLCWVTAENAESLQWQCLTPQGPHESAFQETGWLFASLQARAPQPASLNIWELAQQKLKQQMFPLMKLTLMTLLVNALAWGVGLVLCKQYPQALQDIGFVQLVLLAIIMVIGIALNQGLDMSRMLIMRNAITAPQPDGSATDATEGPLLRLMFITFCLIALDLPLMLSMLLGIWSMGSAQLTLLPFAYVVTKTLGGLLTLWHARDLVKVRGIVLPGEFASSVREETDTAQSLGIPSWLAQRLHALNHDQLMQNAYFHRFAVWALRDNHGLRQLGFIGWLIVSFQISTEPSALTLGSWLACSLWVTRIIALVSAWPLVALLWLQATWVLLSKRQMQDQMGLKHPLTPQPPLRLPHGHVHLSQVSFHHAAQLYGLYIGRMSIKPGERIALLGDPGSGKSTLIQLMAGLLPPDSGQVILDQFKAHEVSARLLQQDLAYLPQNVQLLTGTLRENLLAAQANVPDAELLNLCQNIGLMPLINAHAQGLSMPLHDGQFSVSAGQRQLIGLARLLLRRPRIWMLDEPLAHLNAPLRQRVLNLLQSRILPDQTVICTGDQPELLQLAQRFVVMGSGRVVMDGNGTEVLPRWDAYLQKRRSIFEPKSQMEYQI